MFWCCCNTNSCIKLYPRQIKFTPFRPQSHPQKHFSKPRNSPKHFDWPTSLLFIFIIRRASKPCSDAHIYTAYILYTRSCSRELRIIYRAQNNRWDSARRDSSAGALHTREGTWSAPPARLALFSLLRAKRSCERAHTFSSAGESSCCYAERRDASSCEHYGGAGSCGGAKLRRRRTGELAREESRERRGTYTRALIMSFAQRPTGRLELTIAQLRACVLIAWWLLVFLWIF